MEHQIKDAAMVGVDGIVVGALAGGYLSPGFWCHARLAIFPEVKRFSLHTFSVVLEHGQVSSLKVRQMKSSMARM